MKGVAKQLLEHIHEQARARLAPQGGDDGRRARRRSATSSTSFPPIRTRATVFDAKVQAVFDHVCTAYGDDGVERLRRSAVGRRSQERRPSRADRPIDDDHRRRSSSGSASTPSSRRSSPSSSRGDGAAPSRDDRRADRRTTRTTPSSSSRPPAGTSVRSSRNPAIEDAIVKTVAGVPQHRRRHAPHRRRPRPVARRPRARLPAGQAAERRRLRQLAHDAPHQRARRRRGHAHARADRRPRRRRALPARRRAVIAAGLGEDEQGASASSSSG